MTDNLMPLPAMAQTSTSVPPAVLLANHLKALKLPTFVREYEKVAFEAAQDRGLALAPSPGRAVACAIRAICCGYASSSGSTANAGWWNAVSAWQSSRTPRALTPSILPPSHR
jgi:hypothetical protein